MIKREQLQMYPMGEENGLKLIGGKLRKTETITLNFESLGRAQGLIKNFNFKPELRSLYQLTQSITHEGYNDGKPFVPIDTLWKSFGDTYDFEIMMEGEVKVTEYSFEICSLLISWHFNIFGIPPNDYIEKQ